MGITAERQIEGLQHISALLLARESANIRQFILVGRQLRRQLRRLRRLVLPMMQYSTGEQMRQCEDELLVYLNQVVRIAPSHDPSVSTAMYDEDRIPIRKLFPPSLVDALYNDACMRPVTDHLASLVQATALDDIESLQAAITAFGADFTNAIAEASLGFTLLHFAAYHGSVRVLELLLEGGAEHTPDARGRRPLHIAALQLSLPAVLLMLSHRHVAGLLAQEQRDADGNTPLLSACARVERSRCQYISADVLALVAALCRARPSALWEEAASDGESALEKLLVHGSEAVVSGALALAKDCPAALWSEEVIGRVAVRAAALGACGCALLVRVMEAFGSHLEAHTHARLLRRCLVRAVGGTAVDSVRYIVGSLRHRAPPITEAADRSVEQAALYAAILNTARDDESRAVLGLVLQLDTPPELLVTRPATADPADLLRQVFPSSLASVQLLRRLSPVALCCLLGRQDALLALLNRMGQCDTYTCPSVYQEVSPLVCCVLAQSAGCLRLLLRHTPHLTTLPPSGVVCVSTREAPFTVQPLQLLMWLIYKGATLDTGDMISTRQILLEQLHLSVPQEGRRSTSSSSLSQQETVRSVSPHEVAVQRRLETVRERLVDLRRQRRHDPASEREDDLAVARRTLLRTYLCTGIQSPAFVTGLRVLVSAGRRRETRTGAPERRHLLPSRATRDPGVINALYSLCYLLSPGTEEPVRSLEARWGVFAEVVDAPHKLAAFTASLLSLVSTATSNSAAAQLVGKCQAVRSLLPGLKSAIEDGAQSCYDFFLYNSHRRRDLAVVALLREVLCFVLQACETSYDNTVDRLRVLMERGALREEERRLCVRLDALRVPSTHTGTYTETEASSAADLLVDLVCGEVSSADSGLLLDELFALRDCFLRDWRWHDSAPAAIKRHSADRQRELVATAVECVLTSAHGHYRPDIIDTLCRVVLPRLCVQGLWAAAGTVLREVVALQSDAAAAVYTPLSTDSFTLLLEDTLHADKARPLISRSEVEAHPQHYGGDNDTVVCLLDLVLRSSDEAALSFLRQFVQALDTLPEVCIGTVHYLVHSQRYGALEILFQEGFRCSPLPSFPYSPYFQAYQVPNTNNGRPLHGLLGLLEQAAISLAADAAYSRLCCVRGPLRGLLCGRDGVYLQTGTCCPVPVFFASVDCVHRALPAPARGAYDVSLRLLSAVATRGLDTCPRNVLDLLRLRERWLLPLSSTSDTALCQSLVAPSGLDALLVSALQQDIARTNQGDSVVAVPDPPLSLLRLFQSSADAGVEAAKGRLEVLLTRSPASALLDRLRSELSACERLWTTVCERAQLSAFVRLAYSPEGTALDSVARATQVLSLLGVPASTLTSASGGSEDHPLLGIGQGLTPSALRERLSRTTCRGLRTVLHGWVTHRLIRRSRAHEVEASLAVFRGPGRTILRYRNALLHSPDPGRTFTLSQLSVEHTCTTLGPASAASTARTNALLSCWTKQSDAVTGALDVSLCILELARALLLARVLVVATDYSPADLHPVDVLVGEVRAAELRRDMLGSTLLRLPRVGLDCPACAAGSVTVEQLRALFSVSEAVSPRVYRLRETCLAILLPLLLIAGTEVSLHSDDQMPSEEDLDRVVSALESLSPCAVLAASPAQQRSLEDAQVATSPSIGICLGAASSSSSARSGDEFRVTLSAEEESGIRTLLLAGVPLDSALYCSRLRVAENTDKQLRDAYEAGSRLVDLFLRVSGIHRHRAFLLGGDQHNAGHMLHGNPLVPLAWERRLEIAVPIFETLTSLGYTSLCPDHVGRVPLAAAALLGNAALVRQMLAGTGPKTAPPLLCEEVRRYLVWHVLMAAHTVPVRGGSANKAAAAALGAFEETVTQLLDGGLLAVAPSYQTLSCLHLALMKRYSAVAIRISECSPQQQWQNSQTESDQRLTSLYLMSVSGSAPVDMYRTALRHIPASQLLTAQLSFPFPEHQLKEAAAIHYDFCCRHSPDDNPAVTPPNRHSSSILSTLISTASMGRDSTPARSLVGLVLHANDKFAALMEHTRSQLGEELSAESMCGLVLPLLEACIRDGCDTVFAALLDHASRLRPLLAQLESRTALKELFSKALLAGRYTVVGLLVTRFPGEVEIEWSDVLHCFASAAAPATSNAGTDEVCLFLLRQFAKTADASRVRHLINQPLHRTSSLRVLGGDTILLHAVRRGAAAWVEALLALGADPLVRDGGGMRPLEVSAAAGRCRVTAALAPAYPEHSAAATLLCSRIRVWLFRRSMQR